MKALITNKKRKTFGKTIELYATKKAWEYEDDSKETYGLNEFLDVREIPFEKEKCEIVIQQLKEVVEAIEIYEVENEKI